MTASRPAVEIFANPRADRSAPRPGVLTHEARAEAQAAIRAWPGYAPTPLLDLPGLARTLSLPVDADDYSSELLTSYRLANGVLHNPRNDRRTTAGVFHIAEGGLPIPDDKKAVPADVFAALLGTPEHGRWRIAPDWEGGTRIGAALHGFNRDWSRRVLEQGAVVMIIRSEGRRVGKKKKKKK